MTKKRTNPIGDDEIPAIAAMTFEAEFEKDAAYPEWMTADGWHRASVNLLVSFRVAHQTLRLNDRELDERTRQEPDAAECIVELLRSEIERLEACVEFLESARVRMLVTTARHVLRESTVVHHG
ncbi:MAG: hypothetical protein AB7J30_12550 [Hyphomicrobium sp.]|uniref:hypothetical protein n=1 Tax=Hyphomicrobium sp. TaxID=82 RepID=UPI003D112B5A